ncbi:hypothetical protein BJX99DRAFT_54670 [Aspergillus californicus]
MAILLAWCGCLFSYALYTPIGGYFTDNLLVQMILLDIDTGCMVLWSHGWFILLSFIVIKGLRCHHRDLALLLFSRSRESDRTKVICLCSM